MIRKKFDSFVLASCRARSQTRSSILSPRQLVSAFQNQFRREMSGRNRLKTSSPDDGRISSTLSFFPPFVARRQIGRWDGMGESGRNAADRP